MSRPIAMPPRKPGKAAERRALLETCQPERTLLAFSFSPDYGHHEPGTPPAELRGTGNPPARALLLRRSRTARSQRRAIVAMRPHKPGKAVELPAPPATRRFDRTRLRSPSRWITAGTSQIHPLTYECCWKPASPIGPGVRPPSPRMTADISPVHPLNCGRRRKPAARPDPIGALLLPGSHYHRRNVAAYRHATPEARQSR